MNAPEPFWITRIRETVSIVLPGAEHTDPACMQDVANALQEAVDLAEDVEDVARQLVALASSGMRRGALRERCAALATQLTTGRLRSALGDAQRRFHP